MNNEKMQRKLELLYVDALLNQEPEKVQAPYTVRKKAYENYEKVLMLLAQLKMQGKCDFTYDSLGEPYTLHCIYVQWKSNDGYIELTTTEIIKVLEKMEDIVINEQNDYEWQLSSTIYVEAK